MKALGDRRLAGTRGWSRPTAGTHSCSSRRRAWG